VQTVFCGSIVNTYYCLAAKRIIQDTGFPKQQFLQFASVFCPPQTAIFHQKGKKLHSVFCSETN
jgi:hypothetical protein